MRGLWLRLGHPLLDGLRSIDRLPGEIAEAIATLDAALSQRPAPQVWSPHEYIWHLADIFRLSAE